MNPTQLAMLAGCGLPPDESSGARLLVDVAKTRDVDAAVGRLSERYAWAAFVDLQAYRTPVSMDDNSPHEQLVYVCDQLVAALAFQEASVQQPL